MGESRDRLLSRGRGEEEEVVVVVGRLLRKQRREACGGALAVYLDQPQQPPHFRWGSTPLSGVVAPVPLLQTAVASLVQRRRRNGGHSVLPSWYPRRALHDVTPILTAIERRRTLSSSVPEDEPEADSPTPQQNQIIAEGADVCFFTPKQPEKPLNDTDSVVKSILENARKLKSTPSAKKAERAKKVQTLMSMRSLSPMMMLKHNPLGPNGQ